jgi:hypothetical protein
MPKNRRVIPLHPAVTLANITTSLFYVQEFHITTHSCIPLLKLVISIITSLAKYIYGEHLPTQITAPLSFNQDGPH